MGIFARALDELRHPGRGITTRQASDEFGPSLAERHAVMLANVKDVRFYASSAGHLRDFIAEAQWQQFEQATKHVAPVSPAPVGASRKPTHH